MRMIGRNHRPFCRRVEFLAVPKCPLDCALPNDEANPFIDPGIWMSLKTISTSSSEC